MTCRPCLDTYIHTYKQTINQYKQIVIIHKSIETYSYIYTWLQMVRPPQPTHRGGAGTLCVHVVSLCADLRTTTYYYVLLRSTTYYVYVLLRTTYTYYYVLLRTTYYVLLRTTSYVLRLTYYYVLRIRTTYYVLRIRTTYMYYVYVYVLRTTTYYYVLLRTTTYYYVLLRTTTYYYVLLRSTYYVLRIRGKTPPTHPQGGRGNIICTCSIFVCRHKNNDMSTLLGHVYTYIQTNHKSIQTNSYHT